MVIEKNNYFDIAIIGGGPSGLSAAISAYRYCIKNNLNLKIAIFEAQEYLGKTILKTGNGRCNFSNLYIDEDGVKQYRNYKFCSQVFNNCDSLVFDNLLFGSQPEENMSSALQMFEDLGLACYADQYGGLFPYTNKASSVVDVLTYAIKFSNIKVNKNYKLINIKFDENYKKYTLKFENGKQVTTRKIIFCNGKSILNIKKLKEDIVPIKKVLGPIKANNEFTKKLDGIKVHAGCSVVDCNGKTENTQIGELLFRKYGLSGICIFNLSRFIDSKQDQKIVIDFAPEDSLEDLLNIIFNRYNKLIRTSKVSAKYLFAGMLLPKIVEVLCDCSHIDGNEISKQEVKTLCKTLKNFTVDIDDIYYEKQCQIARGGIKIDCINAKTMHHKKLKNIYFAGEAVDVDGPCGGYNLHWAWTSGILAGISSASGTVPLANT